MYAHTHIHIYTYISQHVDPPKINALCMGGGTRCSGRVSSKDICHHHAEGNSAVERNKRSNL